MDAPPRLAARLTGEAVGTFAIVYVAVLAVYSGSSLVGLALANGLVVAVMASAFMFVSGAHFNPAVTLALWLGRRISARDAGLYVAVQVGAAVVAALVARLSLGGDDIGAGVPAVANGLGPASAILVEALLTFFLVVVIYGTAVDPRFGARIGGLAIGLTVSVGILAAGPLTGAAMNPARWFGPALAAADLGGALVYLLGPLLGGLLGALLSTKVVRPGPAP